MGNLRKLVLFFVFILSLSGIGIWVLFATQGANKSLNPTSVETPIRGIVAGNVDVPIIHILPQPVVNIQKKLSPGNDNLLSSSDNLSSANQTSALVDNHSDEMNKFVNPTLPSYLLRFMNEWQPEEVGGCYDIWGISKTGSIPPLWLSTPENAEYLQSSVSYYYLAGALIKNGIVDASQCPSGGYEYPNTDNLAANSCGVRAAQPVVVEWQNRFNQIILDVAVKTGVPAHLIKNVFSQESQFWPGLYNINAEAGLGQLSENGADTLLLLRPGFFQELCSLTLDQNACSQGYDRLSATEKALLRGLLFQMVNASCQECQGKIDWEQANFSVGVFAENMLANCQQVGLIVNNVTSEAPGKHSSYTDLWKFTMVNYNAGAGCLTNAIQEAWKTSHELTWDLVSAQFDTHCRNATSYVDNITWVPPYIPSVTPTP